MTNFPKGVQNGAALGEQIAVRLVGIDNAVKTDYHDGTTTSYYYQYDVGGNVTRITDGNKDAKALYEYEGSGALITKCGSLANDFLFSWARLSLVR